mgnify:CR=1 FL=1
MHCLHSLPSKSLQVANELDWVNCDTDGGVKIGAADAGPPNVSCAEFTPLALVELPVVEYARPELAVWLP